MRKMVFNIVISGMLVALAVLLGSFAWFPLFGGNVYLVGLVIFAIPIFVPLPFALVSGIISVVLVDIITGWVQYTWITALAYGASIIIVWLFIKLRLSIFYFVGLVLAMLANIFIYYTLILATIDHAYAIATVIATSIQFAIILPVSFMLYVPFKVIKKTLPN